MTSEDTEGGRRNNRYLQEKPKEDTRRKQRQKQPTSHEGRALSLSTHLHWMDCCTYTHQRNETVRQNKQNTKHKEKTVKAANEQLPKKDGGKVKGEDNTLIEKETEPNSPRITGGILQT